MADMLRWSPTEFWSPNFDTAHAHLRKVPGGSVAVSIGRTWSSNPNTVPENVGFRWRPFRFSMGSAATPQDFVVIHPSGGFLQDLSSTTPAVDPIIHAAAIE